MNERIDKLIEQCTDHHFSYCIGGFETFNKEKFAELIIQDCIEQAHSVANLRGVNDDMIYGADIAAGRIAKHFGVEKWRKEK